MSAQSSCLYIGRVVHQRVKPRRHRLDYRVFSMCLDVDEIDQLARELPIFSRNRFNWASFHDRDHGAGDGTPVARHARELLAEAGLARFGARIRLLCYPRILGYVFNPLSVYFCEDEHGLLGGVVYEVNNTFAERKSYVIPVERSPDEAIVRQTCAKELYVSPFTHAHGRYSFNIRPPSTTDDEVLVGIVLHDTTGAVLNARFAGRRQPLASSTLARALLRHPLMTLKVVGGIHLEAARLWAKGVPLVPRHVSPAYSYTVVAPVPDTPTARHVHV